MGSQHAGNVDELAGAAVDLCRRLCIRDARNKTADGQQAVLNLRGYDDRRRAGLAGLQRLAHAALFEHDSIAPFGGKPALVIFFRRYRRAAALIGGLAQAHLDVFLGELTDKPGGNQDEHGEHNEQGNQPAFHDQSFIFSGFRPGIVAQGPHIQWYKARIYRRVSLP